MKVGILGASGVIGRSLSPMLRDRGFSVRSVTRDPDRHGVADERCTADILRPESLEPALRGLDAVINLATCIPNGHGRGDWTLNDRIRTEGVRNLIGSIARLGGHCRLVQQSVAMLHASDRLVDETSELLGQGVLTSSLLMEASVQQSELDWVLVRGGALYGPETTRDASFFTALAAGRLQPQWPARWISLVHVDDLAAAFAHAVELPGRQAYIAADNIPTTCGQLCAAFAGPDPTPAQDACVMAALPSFRVSNRKLRRTGWVPRHPDVFRTMQARICEPGAEATL